jgi:hypothetical protein
VLLLNECLFLLFVIDSVRKLLDTPSNTSYIDMDIDIKNRGGKIMLGDRTHTLKTKRNLQREALMAIRQKPRSISLK